jgi:DNA polymerase
LPSEINRYSTYLREHISLINPKILIIMGSTAMEALVGNNIKISKERGKWKEIIIKDKTYLSIITFHPAYLLRQPDQKKYSWSDLKEIRKKIDELNINI